MFDTKTSSENRTEPDILPLPHRKERRGSILPPSKMAARCLRRVSACWSRGTLAAPERILCCSLPRAFCSEFRSVYSLDKLYPSSQAQSGAKQSKTEIPLDRLTISYSRSSGPGGQHVNKVNSKAEVRFQLTAADWIAEDVRQKIVVMHKNKINKSGELIVSSEVSRYQMRNLAECLQKIENIIAGAIQKPKARSKEDAEIRRIRVENMNRERLQQKKFNSIIKQGRKVDVE
ncbi:peptidyl-tRNA hydrolase ICT1, mitochondrial [Rhinatrema bivittatum]|uniref:peptidyl-tRNA hydrolase ICT1, mitochondrial n=1 Tax=Rhinatrema bivittatum TaxID=194408 RepID=UPI001125CEB6|nr:peptidyl-tRNA hydrolase ICT1, mitochondrial [Rhinatrema bivittatum]